MQDDKRQELIRFFSKWGEENGGVTSYVVGYEKIKPLWLNNRQCHAEILDFEVRKDCSYVASSLWSPDYSYSKSSKEYDKKREMFFSFVFDPKRSPWRKCLINSEILRDKDGAALALYTEGVEAPANLFFNMLVVTRQSFERPEKINLFYRLVKDYKMDEYEAYFLSMVGNLHEEDYVVYNQPSNHNTIVMHRFISLPHFKKGVRAQDFGISLGFNKYTNSPTPAAAIWNLNNGVGLAEQDVKEHLMKASIKPGSKVYKGLFPRLWRENNHNERCALDDFVKYFKKEVIPKCR